VILLGLGSPVHTERAVVLSGLTMEVQPSFEAGHVAGAKVVGTNAPLSIIVPPSMSWS
jgi:hypothetical protein